MNPYQYGVGDKVVIVKYTPKLPGQRETRYPVGRTGRILFQGGEWGWPANPAYTVEADGDRYAVVEDELRPQR